MRDAEATVTPRTAADEAQGTAPMEPHPARGRGGAKSRAIPSEARESRGTAETLVPVAIEFQQELGGLLKAHVRWNDEPRVTQFRSGDRETFAVVPGEHMLHFACRMSPYPPTTGSLELLAMANEPIRIELDVRARTDGAEVQARVWKHNQLVLERLFKPPQL